MFLHGSELNKTRTKIFGRRGGLIVSVLVFGWSGPGWYPGVVFLDKTLHFHNVSLSIQAYNWVPATLMPAMD